MQKLIYSFAIVGAVSLVSGASYVALFTYCGERQTLRIRELFVRSAFRQEAAWFDRRGDPQELPTLAANALSRINAAVGRQIADTFSNLLERLIEVFKAHNIGYFFYNGGGDSADTCLKVSQLSATLGYPIQAIHIPKTVDNDLPLTDNCPGFGSVAKYIAISTREAALDVASMCETSTKVFILEVMGRHAGWIAAAGGLAADREGDAPHIILFPEIAFDRARFLRKVQQTVKKCGHCVIVASEGAQYADGRFLADAGTRDAFGHAQLGGVAPTLAEMVKSELGYKYHWAVADYLQRAARHIASATDVEQAYAVGKAAVEFALAGRNAVMPAIVRTGGKRYGWKIGEAPLEQVANVEKKMPRNFITRDGFGITAAAREYLAPLVAGEDYPPYRNGLPQYVKLRNVLVPRKLKSRFKV